MTDFERFGIEEMFNRIIARDAFAEQSGNVSRQPNSANSCSESWIIWVGAPTLADPTPLTRRRGDSIWPSHSGRVRHVTWYDAS